MTKIVSFVFHAEIDTLPQVDKSVSMRKTLIMHFTLIPLLPVMTG